MLRLFLDLIELLNHLFYHRLFDEIQAQDVSFLIRLTYLIIFLSLVA